MKVKFFQRVNTRISLLPMSILLVILIAGGIGFYFFGYARSLQDFHKGYFITLASEKKTAFDSWFAYHKSDLDGLSSLGILKDNASILAGAQPGVKLKRKMAEQINHSQALISKLLEDKTLSGRYKMLSVISKDGRVISSSRQDILNADWSGRDFFKQKTVDLKSPVVIGFYGADGADYGIEMLSPVFAGSEQIAFIHAVLPVKELAGFLKTEKSFYRTGKIDVTDTDGNLLLVKDGAPQRKIRYNIPKGGHDISGYRDDIFFYAVDLEQAPLRLVGTADKSDVTRPFNILLIGYCSLVGAVLLMTIIQNSYLAQRIITKPIYRLTNAVKSFSFGDLNVDMGKGYKGELTELKKSIEDMFEDIKAREESLRENIRGREKTRLKSMFFSKMSREFREPLNNIIGKVKSVLDGETDPSRKAIIDDIIGAAQNTLRMMDDLIELSRLEEGTFSMSPEKFNMCEMVKEVEDAARNLIGSKEIELIADCQDVLADKAVYADRHRVKQILENFTTNAIKTTEAGTVTILSSSIVKDGVEYMEVSVADTGAGIEPEMLEHIFEELSEQQASIGLAIAKKAADALGGKIDVESAAGKGSVFTVTIPLKAIIYH
ncbi:MAG: HAMP domain-containing histidine kinase [Nitrospirae bacterium]|nr:HAMP domain-containing histidine kinase [Nitrospirota bacterium]MCL5978509.1 HAMP domain-containing histidine kinase [Nitrospirota bacterium]